LEDSIRYLEWRQPDLPDDEVLSAWRRIASKRVEKFNDGSVSAQWKLQGMEWTEAAVAAWLPGKPHAVEVVKLAVEDAAEGRKPWW
jgi:hypothetical protein